MPKIREPRPKYEREVDRDLFAYCDSLKAIDHQQSIIYHAAYSDARHLMRLTNNYDSLSTQHMASSASAIADVNRIEQAENIIMINRNYMNCICNEIEYAFHGDKEIFRFIELYWWTFPRTSIKIRKDVVVGNMPFLRDQDSGRKPFYDYRKKIYLRLAEVWGYSTEDYILPQKNALNF